MIGYDGNIKPLNAFVKIFECAIGFTWYEIMCEEVSCYFIRI